MLSGIYAISDTTFMQNPKEALQKAIKGGISLFQLRNKTSTNAKLAPLCATLQTICAKANVLFVLNDRIDLAITLNSPALHIGKNSLNQPYSFKELQIMRKRFHGILGVSCYGSLELAQNALKAGADYIAFGACFPSQTKPNAPIISLELFAKAKRFGIPLCAIGGINTNNVAQLQLADMIACVRSIWQGDIINNVQMLKQYWQPT